MYVVSGINPGEPPVKFYFDERSGLLLRMLRYVESPLGRNPTQIDYADYRDEGNVKIPFQRIIARPGSRVTIQIEEAPEQRGRGRLQICQTDSRTSAPETAFTLGRGVALRSQEI